MHDHHTTSGSPQPDVEERVTLEDCLTVVTEVLPSAIGGMHLVCSRVTLMGEHPIPDLHVWKDVDTNEVFCSLRCAAEEAIEKAARSAQDEAIYRRAARA